MGAFDDIEAKGSSSPTRFSMLGRGIGEARRKFFLFALLAFFLLLTFVAFRRQDKIKDIVDQSFHRSNATAAVSKPDLKPDSKSDPKSDPKSDSKLQSEQSKSRLKPETSSSYGQGPVLATANGDRYLAKSSLNDIHNTSLGVCYFQQSKGRILVLTRLPENSSRRSTFSMCPDGPISSI